MREHFFYLEIGQYMRYDNRSIGSFPEQDCIETDLDEIEFIMVEL